MMRCTGLRFDIVNTSTSLVRREVHACLTSDSASYGAQRPPRFPLSSRVHDACLRTLSCTALSPTEATLTQRDVPLGGRT